MDYGMPVAVRAPPAPLLQPYPRSAGPRSPAVPLTQPGVPPGAPKTGARGLSSRHLPRLFQVIFRARGGFPGKPGTDQYPSCRAARSFMISEAPPPIDSTLVSRNTRSTLAPRR